MSFIALCCTASHRRTSAASRQPDGAVLTIFWQIWICFALVYLIAGGAFVAGALVAYAWYLFVHHCAHHGPDKLPLPLLMHHQSHHRFATRNYGVSTRCGITYSERCLADGVVAVASINHSDGMSSLLTLTQLIARSAIFLSAFPYNVPRTENPPVCYLE